METKELKITIPEGFEIDKENSTFEKIVFKKKDIKPRSWEEYCKQQAINDKKGYQINDASCSIFEVCWRTYSKTDYWRNVLPSRELTESFLAMMQLMSLREAWIGDWKPKASYSHWCMYYDINTNSVGCDQMGVSHALEFPTKEMAKEFLNCFKDLLEIAKPLL